MDDRKLDEQGPSLQAVFAALADETRLQLVGLLSQQQLCVCDLVDSLDDPQPKVSRHLAYLRRVGLVTTHRQGKWIRYALRRPLPWAVELLLPLLREHAVRPAHASASCCPDIDGTCAGTPDPAVNEVDETPHGTSKPRPVLAARSAREAVSDVTAHSVRLPHHRLP